ncbi:hypothetical protein Q1W71_11865 [Flavobacterium pectinovorum]|uniref:hypothetical protein n=1 Tax=Flavobacterium pectinovorum TaxID=29533 RepID=UPI00265ED1D0|nr:hypothetical protein [Flavobacterium pectinovorum]WKL50441.1 hypothetical protein Q1W71_11865 [Flavobacterium pectinovorum]
MTIEEIIINRNQIWLSYEEVLEVNKDNVLEPAGFICYFNREMPQLIFGESIKDDNGKIRRFDTIKEASEIAKVILERKIYPPFFLSPLLYEMYNIAEIMHKPIKIEIGQTSEDIDEIVEGKIIRCTSTSNNHNLLASILFEKANEETQTYSIFDLQKFNKP